MHTFVVNSTKPAYLDVLILLVVLPAYIANSDAFLVVMALLAYLLIRITLPLPEAGASLTRKNRVGFVLCLACIWILITAIVILPTVTHVIERWQTPIAEDGFSWANATLSDSALQTELALAYLDNGRNPYVESYADTPLRFYQWEDVADPDWEDPAYHYFVYFPGTLYLSYPIYKIFQWLGIPYDQRLIYLGVYVALALMLPGLVHDARGKLALVTTVALNPLFVEPVILGMNDVAPFLAVVCAIWLLQRRRYWKAALCMGVACALKQYAWFITPFFLWHIWQYASVNERAKQLLTAVVLIGGIILCSALPFAIWNFTAFYTDTFAFPAGRVEFLYPIRGFTVGRLLMGAGIIPTHTSPFPFQWLQLLIGVPMLIGMLRFQMRRGVAGMLIAAALFIFVFGVFSRFFHHNYIGIVLALAALGVLLDLYFPQPTGQIDEHKTQQ